MEIRNMKNFKTKNVNKLVWEKSYSGHLYAFNVVTYPFTIRCSYRDCTADKGYYHLYFGSDCVGRFDSLQKAKNFADSINNQLEVA